MEHQTLGKNLKSTEVSNSCHIYGLLFLTLPYWKCHKCNSINTQLRVRCASCCSWKGVKRNSYTKKSSAAHVRRKQKAAAETLAALTESASQSRAELARANKEQFHQLLKEKSQDTPLRSNQSTSPKKSAAQSHLNLDEIQVGDAEFTSPFDTVGTAAT